MSWMETKPCLKTSFGLGMEGLSFSAFLVVGAMVVDVGVGVGVGVDMVVDVEEGVLGEAGFFFKKGSLIFMID